MMKLPDLNLIIALDALLEEGSVVGAARRMNLSAPAMSRTLGRIRQQLNDPVLVKVGRSLVPTPRALALREQVQQTLHNAVNLLQPENILDVTQLTRTFTLHANDVFISAFGGELLARLRQEAPNVGLRFTPESHTDENGLNEGKVDLYISAMRPFADDIHLQTLFTTRFMGLAREAHPIFDQPITPERFATFEQISVSRRGRARGPIDERLAELGLTRHVSLVVPTFHSGVFSLGHSDLILPLPEHVVHAVQKMGIRLRAFALPFDVDNIPIVQAWHPRFQSDAAHRWFRRIVHDLCIRAPDARLACKEGNF
ncbi:LysR family transcriptional regulator [Rouxiella chamberiensis]|uniref:LysR family transcriptional regulator n=1 Tax=Rouxiella chamberiensis TaxID=1513468 RepID=A0ABY7HSP4_9GAMM|nr:LysR family transcriptional regulator [Rouxiella chamberiensis]WAT02385.1 LysR family transcriptional regulator [Rouxiella chamberiensis]